ncbi:hypothetical protein CRM22_002198 [Opisthorchis felineus]|uniref:Phospholipase A2-like central domain-containing protein n=1 Tax=Opisthorchis felineus TaxID=147828 RepID=A0A4S2M7C4_OPIFE|nr:hypothetical protein CRM22_002198 [Opisthorchis felineus]
MFQVESLEQSAVEEKAPVNATAQEVPGQGSAAVSNEDGNSLAQQTVEDTKVAGEKAEGDSQNNQANAAEQNEEQPGKVAGSESVSLEIEKPKIATLDNSAWIYKHLIEFTADAQNKLIIGGIDNGTVIKKRKFYFEWIEIDVVCITNGCTLPNLRMFFDKKRRLRICTETVPVIDHTTFPAVEPADETREYFSLSHFGVLTGINLRKACLSHPSAKATQEALSRRRRNADWFIVPGTLYCGPGDIYVPGGPPALAHKTDKCCEAHDKCPNNIPAYGTRNQFRNQMPSTMSHCDCDQEFFDCLGKANSDLADAVGMMYFDVARIHCFEEEGGDTTVMEPDSYYEANQD